MDDMQRRIARRRAELEQARAKSDADAKAASEAEAVERRAAADREWAERARQKKAQMDEATPTASPADVAARKAATDQLLREAARRKWTGGEWGVIGFIGLIGLMLIASHPVWGSLLLLLAWGFYAGNAASHREQAIKENPDLFGSAVKPTNPPAAGG